MQNQERRRYFRVDVDMIISPNLISQADKSKRAQKLLADGSEHPDSHHVFLTLEAQIQEGLAKLSNEHADVRHILDMLNRKLNLISCGGPVADISGSIMDKKPELVNLSACGIAFKSDVPLSMGQAVELEMVLLPEQAYIVAIGEIVICEKKPLSVSSRDVREKPYRISVDFHAMHEEDMERIVQHIMRKESQLLKARRHLQK